jgi:hypothetical protein
MTTAREYYRGGDHAADVRARYAMPMLLSLAKAGRTITYLALSVAVARQYHEEVRGPAISYARVLDKIGATLERLADEWREEIPPLTILVYSKTTEQPSAGVDKFLGRYATQEVLERATARQRKAIVERATQAVFNWSDWDKVASYLEAEPADPFSETQAIELPSPEGHPIGGEGPEHEALKLYVANHPELFRKFGRFERGRTEAQLASGDEVDVLFANAEQELAVEVKTAAATPGKLTRGVYQCVKYREVLRAQHHVRAEATHVEACLATPQALPGDMPEAMRRLDIRYVQVRRR